MNTTSHVNGPNFHDIHPGVALYCSVCETPNLGHLRGSFTPNCLLALSFPWPATSTAAKFMLSCFFQLIKILKEKFSDGKHLLK